MAAHMSNQCCHSPFVAKVPCKEASPVCANVHTVRAKSPLQLVALLQVCLTGSIQEDNCAADSQACWSNDTMHVDACVDTYRGYVCKCPEGDCVDTYAYAVVVTLRLHLP